jgi:hypothetical protein
MEKLPIIEIDLSFAKKKVLNENLYSLFTGAVGLFLKGIGVDIDKLSIPVRITGTKKEIGAFRTALNNSKQYIETAKAHGKDSDEAASKKKELLTAVSNFEEVTKIKWPVK